MKKTQTVATLAFAVMLGVAIPMINLSGSNDAFAAELESSHAELSAPADGTTTTSVETSAALATAVADENITNIQIASDFTLDSSIEIRRATKIAIDLAGHTLTGGNGSPFKIYQGEVEFSGNGTINGGANGNAVEVFGSPVSAANYTVVTIGNGITLLAPSANHYAISIPTPKGQTKPNVASYGIVVNFAGKIIANYGISINGNIQHTDNCPQVNILDGASIDATSVEDGTPIYAAGTGQWTIGRATLRGEAAIGVKAGELTFNNANVQVTGPEQIVNLANGKIIGTGSTFQLEHNPVYADQIAININGGSYSSAQSHVFYEYDESTTSRAATIPADINITAGTFTAAASKNIFSGLEAGQVDVEISGGTFSGADVADFSKNGYLVGNLIVDANGNVRRPSSHGSSTDVEAPEDPSDSEEPSDPALTPDDPQDENRVPDTGIISDRGIISAIGTIAPLLTAAGFALMFFSGKIHERQRQRRLASLESEMSEEIEQIIDESQPEPVLDHFIAVPIARDEPTIAPVDPFIPHTK